MKTISKSEAVKNRIIADIRSGCYSNGGALPSIETLALQLEVSKNTVSLALAALHDAGIVRLEHGKATRVTDKLFQRHIEIITNGQAPVGNDAFWGRFSHGIDDELQSREDISYHHSGFGDSFFHQDGPVPEHIREGGVILMGEAGEMYIRRLKRERIPFCLVYDFQEKIEAPVFGVEFDNVFDRVARRLAEAGCRRVCYIGALTDGMAGYSGVNRHKRALFQQALLRYDIPVIPELQIVCQHVLSEGYRVMRGLLASGMEFPDAVFFGSDLLAPGGFKALHESGLKVPEDVLAVGCDGVEIGSYLIPAVSTIEFDRYEIGRSAAAAVADHITRGTPIAGRNFEAVFTERESFPLYTTALKQRIVSRPRTKLHLD